MLRFTLILFSVLLVAGCKSNTTNIKNQMDINTNGVKIDTATFASCCFWCVEAIFQELKGVLSVTSGYTGGKIKNPTYREVCSGLTGHAEACQIIYDPTIISFDELLEAFWASHDPTTLNRQGADQGTQYRSAVFYHNEQQKQLAEAYKAKLNSEKAFDKPIVTEISPAVTFYKAEDYHQNYYSQNGDAPYCSFVIVPKLEKFRKVFKDKLK
jgi:peptide-methionine (S)-S-oxide reductase